MTQPAVSDALRRLRKLLRDDLLIPDGRNLVTTALAERLIPSLEASLSEVESIFSARFDPASFKGTFKIATADYCVLLLGGALMATLRTLAPGVSVQFVEVGPGCVPELHAGEIDFIIVPGPLPNVPLDGLDFSVLFEDDMVCIVSGKEAVDRPLTVEDLLGRRHATFGAGKSITGHFGAGVLRQAGIDHFDAICAPNFMLLPFLVEQTDSIAIVQRRLADRLAASTCVHILEPPIPFPTLRIVLGSGPIDMR